MERYNNEDYYKKDIINQGRHQFIYAYDGKKRTNFLKEIEKENPVVENENKPMAVYIQDYGLKEIEYDRNRIDNSLLKLLATEYFNFSTLSSVIQSCIDNNIYDEKIINKFNDSYELEIKKIDDLLKLLNESKDFYKEYYEAYLETYKMLYSIDDIKIPFVEPTIFLKGLKDALNNNSYFAFLIDNNKKISGLSTRVINYYVGRRMTDTISMKIATEPDKWETYVDINGDFTQPSHDFGDIELDDVNKNTLNKAKRRFFRK
jgi:hypothetical protein